MPKDIFYSNSRGRLIAASSITLIWLIRLRTKMLQLLELRGLKLVLRRHWQLPRATSLHGRVSASDNLELRHWEGLNKLVKAARCSPHMLRSTSGMLVRVAGRVLESGRETV